MSVTITFNGTIIEGEGFAYNDAPGSNNISVLPSTISGELSSAISTDKVSSPTAANTDFPTYAEKDGIVSFSGTNVGASGSVSALFTDSSGALLNGADSGLTADNGQHIFLYTSPSNNEIVYGIAQSSPGSISSGSVVFAIVLQPVNDSSGNLTSGNFFIEQWQPIHNSVASNPDNNEVDPLAAGSLFVSATQPVTFDFSGVKPTKYLWVAAQPATGVTTPNVLVTGLVPNDTAPSAGDQVNVSSTGLAADSQSIVPGQGLRFDFVNNAPAESLQSAPFNSDPNNLTFGGYLFGHGAQWAVTQVNGGSSKTATVDAHIVAIDNTDSSTGGTEYFNQISNPGTTQSQDIIDQVTVLDPNGNPLGKTITNPNPNGGLASGPFTVVSGITVSFDASGGANVFGLSVNDKVQFRTTAPMDRFIVTNISKKNTFDIGGITSLDTASSHADASLQVGFEDAGPLITASATNEPTLTTTDTTAANPTTASNSFAAQFAVNFGADGKAGSNPTAYALSTAGGASGLTDTLSQQSVVLSLVNGQIVGTAGATGPTVFTVSVDGSGNVTLTQDRAVVQPLGTNPDKGETVGLSGTNLVVLSETVTDGDGDQATASLDLTPQLLFKDVGPTITANTMGEPTLTTTDTTSANPTTATSAFAGQFAVNYNADGPAQPPSNPNTYALSTSGNSSLTDTLSGQQVVLSLVNGQIVGTAGATGPTVFTVSVDGSGNVTLTQDRAVVQPLGTNPDNGETVPLGPSGSNDVVLSETVTDGDGDQATASLDLTPQLLFKDVGPTITASTMGEPTLTTTDVLAGTTPSTASASFAGQFAFNYNADGPAQPPSNPNTYALSTAGGASGLTDTQTGQSVVLSLVNGQIVGTAGTGGPTVFAVSVDSSGNVTLTQSRAVKQPLATNGDTGETVPLTGSNLVVLSETVTDGDGDSATASLDLTPQLKFADTGPTIGPISDSTVNFATDSTGTATSTLNGNIGADFVPNAVAYTIVNEPSSLTINGVTLQPVLSTDKSTVIYYQDTNKDGIFGDAGDTAFYKLQLSEPGATPSGGSYTFTVLSPPPPNVLSFNLSTLASGQNLWGLATDASGNNGFVVFSNDVTLNSNGTEASGGTVNTSKGQAFPTVIGISNNQFDPNEGAYVTFVKTPPLSAGGSNNANGINYGGFLEATDAETTITKVTGATKTTGAEVTVQAYDRSQPTSSDQPNEGKDLINQTIAGTNSTPVAISSISITDSAGNDETNKNGRVVTPGSGTGAWDIKGLLSGDTIEWKTSSPADQAQIKDISGTFDIGAVSIIQHQSTPPQTLPFTVQATDGDGDFAQASFNVHINGLTATS